MTTEEITREEKQLMQLGTQQDNAYGAICALVGIVAQLPGVEQVDIKRALGEGFAAMPRQIPGSTRSHELAERIAGIVVGSEQGS